MKTFIIAALSADGFIARHANDFARDWASETDKEIFIRLTKEAGTVVFGSTTARTLIDAKRRLPGRRKIVYTHNPDSITAEGYETTSEAPADLLRRLEKERVIGVAVCGGAQIYSLFLGAGVVDELYLTIEPKLFGSGIAFGIAAQEHNLELLSVSRQGQSVLLHYQVLKT